MNTTTLISRLKNGDLPRRLLALAACVILCIGIAGAQSKGDKYYNEGLAKQKVMTVESQNQAIAKFNSAKKIYDSAAKKKQCDDAISVSRGIIKSLSAPKGSAPKQQTPRAPKESKREEAPKPQATLSLSNSNFYLSQPSTQVEVTVTTNQPRWDVDAVANSDGSGFLKVKKINDDTFRIDVPYNNDAEARVQYVQVTAGDAKERVCVSQSGREIILRADKTIVEAKKKGDKKTLNIYSNGSQSYNDNYGYNWRVLECPSWITIAPKEVKYNISEKDLKSIGLRASDASGLTKCVVEIIVDPYGATRKGDIILECGYKQFKISVNQYK